MEATLGIDIASWLPRLLSLSVLVLALDLPDKCLSLAEACRLKAFLGVRIDSPDANLFMNWIREFGS